MILAGFLREDEREELRALARDGCREARASRRATAIVRQRLFAWIGLAVASGVVEILALVPGRSPSPFDALASTSGLTLGLALGAILATTLSGTDRHAHEIDTRL